MKVNFRAMKTGAAFHVAMIDKGGILTTLLLTFPVRKEPFTAKAALGSALVLAGPPVLIYK